MNAPHQTPDSGAASSAPQASLRTVLLADLGPADGPERQRAREGDLRDLLAACQGQLIDQADGLLALFDRAIHAVNFALCAHAKWPFTRAGIHVGEVVTWSNSPEAVQRGAKQVEVEGLAKPVAARLLGLALPGQILLSGMAQTLAHRAQAELGGQATSLRWCMHGRYRFKGVATAMVVHEVGLRGRAPLRAPPSGEKAWRDIPLWRRPPMLALELLGTAALIAGVGYGVLHSQPALSFSARDWVVVGDFGNFSGDASLGPALDTALRVSLEQSRYVNLLPELKVESALARMRRAATTPVDRKVGSEVALREGARAVLLPSVSRSGDRWRVSVEVVDPSDGVTVYAESADGKGADSTLASLDKVNAALRARLGETLPDIAANGRPLAKVTTNNLAALKAYSEAQAAFSASRDRDALALYRRAVELDPDFAMARIGQARVYSRSGQVARAKELSLAAKRLEARLTQRERLALDIFIARFDNWSGLAQICRVMAAMYPDAYRAYYDYAMDAASYNQFSDGASFLAPALTAKNPKLGNFYYLQGTLLLGMNRYAEAEAAFRRAIGMGVAGRKLEYAETFAARRDFVAAQRILGSQTESGMAGADLQNQLDDAIFLFDQGRWREATARQKALTAAARSASPLQGAAMEVQRLLLNDLQETLAPGALRQELAPEIHALRSPESEDRFAAAFRVLVVGWLAAKHGDPVSAQQALQAVQAIEHVRDEPNVANMRVIVEAELAMASRQPGQAIASLTRRIDGSELQLTHEVLERAYAAAGNPAAALKEAAWIAAQRGRAYAEFSSWESLSPRAVIDTDLALLRAAELAHATGQDTEARSYLLKFDHAWPDASQLPPVSGRRRALMTALHRNPGSGA